MSNSKECKLNDLIFELLEKEYNFKDVIVNYFREDFPELKDEKDLLYQSTLDEIKSTIDRWKKVLKLDINQENIDEFFDLIRYMKLNKLDLREISKEESIIDYIKLFVELQENSYKQYYKSAIEVSAMANNMRLQDAHKDIELQKSKYIIYSGHYEEVGEIINHIWDRVNDLSYAIIMNRELNNIDLKTILRTYDYEGNKMDTIRLLYMHEEQSELLMSKRLDIDKFIDSERLYLKKGEKLAQENINKNTCYRNMYLYLVRKYFKKIHKSEIKCIEELTQDYKYNIHNKKIYNLSDISEIIYNSQLSIEKREYKQINSSIRDSFREYGLDKIFKNENASEYSIRRNEVELCLAYYEYISNRKLKKTNFSKVNEFERFKNIKNQIISVRAKTNQKDEDIYNLVKEFQIMMSNSIDFVLSKINVENQYSKFTQIEDELAHIKFIVDMKLMHLRIEGDET
ncbi:hypothetical protein CHF27_013380 [Romboutsia maritimum]|uniref:Uncharacterized protein n=1 Tax=Romboutsia maritimum TaxID=2020948 RepID=A0A371IPQ1_9FIRM|nr:hypothetical protein [Romboutsia maritimum]RDY22451.1 hypothetical protein CHF27_013380 [Romboutsia maritimum]